MCHTLYSHSDEPYVQSNTPKDYVMQEKSPVKGESQSQLADSPPSQQEKNPTPTAEFHCEAKPTVETTEALMLPKLLLFLIPVRRNIKIQG